jgi:hypothetical protein
MKRSCMEASTIVREKDLIDSMRDAREDAVAYHGMCVQLELESWCINNCSLIPAYTADDCRSISSGR